LLVTTRNQPDKTTGAFWSVSGIKRGFEVKSKLLDENRGLAGGSDIFLIFYYYDFHDNQEKKLGCTLFCRLSRAVGLYKQEETITLYDRNFH